MATDYWKMGKIKLSVREVVGLKNENQLSEEDLEDAINRYYFYQFVLDARPSELEDFWTFTTVDGIDTQTLDDDEDILITADGYVDGFDLSICFDQGTWFANWPETTTYSESRPTEALFYGGVLYMNPPPDDAYSVKIPAYARPSIMLTDEATPAREEWGPSIVYGTSFEILNERGNTARAAEILPVKNMHISNIRYKSEQVINTQRAMPKW